MLDIIIFVYYAILVLRIVYLNFSGEVYVINSAKYNNIFIYIFIALIVIDLVIDLASKSEKRDKELKYDLSRLGHFTLIGAIIIFVQIGLTASRDSYYSGYLFSPITSDVLAEYEPISQKAGELEQKIYDRYGISVFSNLNPSDYYETDNDYITTLETDPVKCEEYLQAIYDELAVYNDEAIKLFPKFMYIVKEFNDYKIAGVNFNTTAPEKGYIVFATKSNDYSSEVIHHELFHTITAFADSAIIKEFENNPESCSLTSSYSCTSTIEFLADSWAYSLAYGKYTEHSDILTALYPEYLRGFGSEELVIDATNYDDVYSAFAEDNRDLIYINNFSTDVLNNLDFKKNMELSYIYYGNDAIVYKHNNNIDYSSLDELSQSLDILIDEFSNYTGIDKILQIYKYLKTLDITTDNNIAGTTYVRKLIRSKLNPALSRNYVYEDYSFRNYCLYLIMDKLGYDVHYEYYINKDNYRMFFVVTEINGYSYVLDYSIEKAGTEYLLGFMVAPDDYRFMLNTSQELNLPSGENDRSYSYYDRILLLEEFDSTLVDNYIINQCKKYKGDTELVFICKWISDTNEVYDYIDNYGASPSRIRQLYNRYVNSNKYPGYTRYKEENICYVYDFEE